MQTGAPVLRPGPRGWVSDAWVLFRCGRLDVPIAVVLNVMALLCHVGDKGGIGVSAVTPECTLHVAARL